MISAERMLTQKVVENRRFRHNFIENDLDVSFGDLVISLLDVLLSCWPRKLFQDLIQNFDEFSFVLGDLVLAHVFLVVTH